MKRNKLNALLSAAFISFAALGSLAHAEYRIVIPSGGTTPTPASTNPPSGGPTVVSGTVDGNQITVLLSEVLGALPATAPFSIDVNGVILEPSSISASGDTLQLVLGVPVTSAATVSLSYNDPTSGNDLTALENEGGEDTDSFTQSLTNNTAFTAPPTVVSSSINGTAMTILFSEALSSATPLSSSLDVTVDGSGVAISSFSVAGSTLTVNLSSAVSNTATVSLDYSDNNSYINDVLAIESSAGTDVATFTSAVTNDTPAGPAAIVSVTSSNSSYQYIYINFDNAIQVSDLKESKFQFYVNGSSYGFPQLATVSGNQVKLKYQYKGSAFSSSGKHVIYNPSYSTGNKIVDQAGNMIPGFDVAF